jgi:hypothetical protein
MQKRIFSNGPQAFECAVAYSNNLYRLIGYTSIHGKTTKAELLGNQEAGATPLQSEIPVVPTFGN